MENSLITVPSFSDLPKQDKNPFVSDVVKHIKDTNFKVQAYKKDSNLAIVDRETGEMAVTYNTIYTKKKVDVQKYNKLYINTLRSLFDLSKNSQLVLDYIYTRLEKNKDYIFFSISDCKEHTNYKDNKSIYSALKELVEKEFIAKTGENYKFWINPTVMFNGDRLVIVNEYIKEEAEIKRIGKNED